MTARSPRVRVAAASALVRAASLALLTSVGAAVVARSEASATSQAPPPETRSSPSESHPSIVRLLGDVEVDWSAGLVSARAGAAADMRMPSADAARPGAERRAREAASAKLRRALPDLPLGRGASLAPTALAKAIARARVIDSELQTNGGVVVRLCVSFADLAEAARDPAGEAEGARPADARSNDAPTSVAASDEAATPELAVSLASAPLELRPRLLSGESERRAAYALYRLGPAPAGAIESRRDRAGRLVLPPGAPLPPAPRVVIHLGKAPR